MCATHNCQVGEDLLAFIKAWAFGQRKDIGRILYDYHDARCTGCGSEEAV
jgi:hypothetical protein